MKNKSLLLFLLVFSQWSFSQTFTTGVVNLSSTAGLTMSVKLDISTNVTMTITGPSLRWFALGFGAVNMANGTDVVGIHSAGALTNFDAKLTGNAAPVTDAQQNWTITSDQVAAGVRTIIATRALNTGDANDYAFTAANGSLSLIWARGSSNSFTYSGHGSTNRGVVNATFTAVAPPLTISTSNSTICSGSSTTLTANSTAGVSYLWSPGGQTTASITVSPITTTTYTCTATENGASSTVSSVITVSLNTSITINQTACNSYIWNGDTLTTSGTYSTLFPNTGGCDSLTNLNLTIVTAPMEPLISVSNGNQFSILPSSIQNGVNYQWVICPELIDFDGATDTIFVPSDGGEYAVVATNSCGSVTSDCLLSTVSVLNTEIETNKVFPTILACGEWLHLPSSKTYNLYDLQGNLICTIPESISELRMDFPAGLYLLKNEGETTKIVLTK
jgi:hypothetical protein